jgi:hypothetical protein
MDEKFWLPTGADGWPVASPDEAHAAEAIRTFEEMARRLEASFPGQPRRPWWRRHIWGL